MDCCMVVFKVDGGFLMGRGREELLVISYLLLVEEAGGRVVGCRLSVVCWPWKKSKVGICGFLSGLSAAMPVRALPVFPGSLTLTPHSGLWSLVSFFVSDLVLEFKDWRRGLGRREKRCPESISGNLALPRETHKNYFQSCLS